jgi:hypothetical protein
MTGINVTPTTPNTTDSGHPGNSMTHTAVDRDDGDVSDSDADEHSHVHYDDGYKLHFGEIASLFEDMQADIRIITDRATTQAKGLYTRDADTIAPNAGNITAQAAFEANLAAAGVLDQLNAEMARPTNFADTTSENYATVQGGGNGFTGSEQYQRPAGYGGASTVIVDNGDGTTTAQRTDDTTLAQLEAAGLATTGSASGNVKYGNQGKIRNRPIQKALMEILTAAANSAKVDVLITSGGQLSSADGGVGGRTRTGSNRHDNGYAADVVIYKDGFTGTELSSKRAEDLAIMVAFMKACKAAGATAIGQGNAYMGDTGIHVDIAITGANAGVISKISSVKYWGGKGARTADAPVYLKDIMVA